MGFATVEKQKRESVTLTIQEVRLLSLNNFTEIHGNDYIRLKGSLGLWTRENIKFHVILNPETGRPISVHLYESGDLNIYTKSLEWKEFKDKFFILKRLSGTI